MKLWQKLSLVTVLTLLVTSGISGAAVIYRSAVYNREKTLENYEQQLISTAYALSRELQDSSVENFRESTKKSYLNFLIRRYDESEYILIENDSVVCNETAFELSDPGDERWAGEEVFGMIQQRGENYILAAGKSVPLFGKEEYKLVLVKDISGLYQDIRRQAFLYLMIYLGMAVCSVFLVFFMTGRILKPLRKLQEAAAGISEGKLGSRARICSKDEIGALAEAFNGMAEKIERQVTA